MSLYAKILTWICIIALVWLLLFGMTRCSIAEQHQWQAAFDKCGMHSGDIVESVIDGRQGMVMYVEYADTNTVMVWIRFSAITSTTNTHILNNDGAITKTPYTQLEMYCFEIKHAK
jgi:hypothetical protein